MPTYVYKCPSCGYTFEAKQSIKTEHEERLDCPSCILGILEKVIQPTALHFKGKGFYETDYKKKG